METQYTRLSMTPSGVPPVIYMSQNDIGRPIGFVCDADLSNYSVVLEATRTDGTPITVAVTVDGNICAFETTATMTNKADVYIAQIVVTNASGKHISSIPIKCVVILAAMNENSEGIEEDAPLYQQYTGTVQSLIADIRTQLNAEASARQAADNQLQSNINAEASARATQDNVLQAEIDQLVAPSGSAPSAAEVTNARIGADGTTYDTLGNAIRGQVTDVKSALNDLPWADEYDKKAVSNGYINTQGNVVTVNAQGWHITDYMSIKSGDSAVYSGLTTVGVSPSSAFYDSSKTLIEVFKQKINENQIQLIPDTAAYVRFSVNDADLNTFSFRVKKLPGLDDLDALESELTYEKTKTIVYTTSSPSWTKKAGYISTQTGWAESASYDSYYFTAEENCELYIAAEGVSYVQLCVYPSGAFGDTNYKRYRTTDSNLPTSENPLVITAGTMVIYTVPHGATTPTLTTEYLTREIKGGKFSVSWNGFRLDISGNGLDCYFSDATFTQTSGGLFELQALTVNDCMIFGTENDYIGPVKLKGESIVGAKHDGETTDSVMIFVDGGAVQTGNQYADSISIYVTSHIDTRFSRVSTYNINRGRLSASSFITQNVDANIENIFGAGIISSYDDSTVAWINNKLLTSGDTSGTLDDQTIIVTDKGIITSRRTQNKTAGTYSPVYFLTYTGRKKLYYYNTYRVQNTDLPAGSVYSSAADLLW